MTSHAPDASTKRRDYVVANRPRSLPLPAFTGSSEQPVSLIQWVPRDRLVGNGWNPNRVARAELTLLAISILEDGWTQPIVVRHDWTIIDGFHRWTVSAWPEVAAITDGHVPVVCLRASDPAQERMATIRHNRARGTHYVLSMADIVNELVDLDVTPDEIARRLGMEAEEVRRFIDRGSMLKRASKPEFNKAWRAE